MTATFERKFYQVTFSFVEHIRSKEVISGLVLTVHAANSGEAQELAIEDIEAYGYSHGSPGITQLVV